MRAVSYLDIARFVREYLEKLEREMAALARKAPSESLRMALLAMAIEKAVAVEVLRALVRALDKYEGLVIVGEQLKRRVSAESLSREDLERALTKLVEVESYQKEVPRLLNTLSQSVELEIVRKLLSVLKEEEQRVHSELKQLIESVNLEIKSLEKNLS